MHEGENSDINDKGKEKSTFRQIFDVVILAVIIALVIRTFIFQPFNIPSSSMEPTLLIGDYLFVTKYSYGYSRYSLPLSIIPFSGRVLARQPKLGDVVVFRNPIDKRYDFIKRLVGLPGDRIQVINGILNINGQPVEREKIDTYQAVMQSGYSFTTTRYKETLPNGVSHYILEKSDNERYDNTPLYVVPTGHYFFMGDNRDGSSDSRVKNSVGFVPFENLIGRAEIRFLSVEPASGGDDTIWRTFKSFFDFPLRIRWQRLFTVIN